MSKPWEHTKLGNCFEIEYGTRVTRKRDAGTTFPVYGGGGETFRVDRSNRKDVAIISRFGMSEQCTRYVSGEFFLNDSGLTLAARDHNRFDKRFIDYLVLSLNDLIYSLGRGTAQKNLDVQSLRGVPVSYPVELAEQKRIVAFLDEALAGIDTAIANAEQNLANVRALFESVLDRTMLAVSVASPRRKLASLCDGRGISYGVIKLGDHVDGGVPCLRTSNVRPLRMDLDGMKKILPSLSGEYRRTILQGGEVLVAIRGTLGGVAVARPEMSGWNVSREVAVVPCDVETVDPQFLAFWIGTLTCQRWLTGVLKGAAYQGINLSDLRELDVPILDARKQAHVVAELSERLADADLLAERYAKKREFLSELRLRLLQLAFAGELGSYAKIDLPEAAE